MQEEGVVERLHGKECRFEVLRQRQEPEGLVAYSIHRDGKSYKGPFESLRAAIASIASELE